MAWIGASKTPAGCVFCDALTAGGDRGRLALTRSDHAFLILNLFPFTSGHLMVVVKRHVGTVVDARRDELADAMGLVQRAITGIEEHLHIHVVPRWNGDSNFMPVVGEVRVLPETLDRTWERLRSHLLV